MTKINIFSQKDVIKICGDVADGILKTGFGVSSKGFIAKAWETLEKISDPDKALAQAITESFRAAFLNGLKHHGLNPEMEESEIGLLITQNTITTTPADKFDIEYFSQNAVIIAKKEHYTTVFGDLLTAAELQKVMHYVDNYIKLYFTELLSRLNVTYSALNAVLASPTYKAYQERYPQIAYQTALRAMYHEPIMGDTTGLTLARLYIEPHFQLYDKSRFVKVPQASNNLHDFVHRFLQDAPQQVLILLGYPGQGKTSFCKRLLHDSLPSLTPSEPPTAHTGEEKKTTRTPIHDADAPQTRTLARNFYYIKMRDIDDVNALLQGDMAETLCKKAGETAKGIARTYKRLEIKQDDFENGIWILDGLDELFMCEGMSLQEADNICARLIEKCKLHHDLRIIITSRYGYLDLDKIAGKSVIIARLDKMTLEQQKTWLHRYKEDYIETYNPYTKKSLRETWLTDEHLEQFYEENHPIGELITQPLLLYIIALLDEKIATGKSRASIYKTLFDTLIKRTYSPDGKIKILEKGDEDDLRTLIRGLAYEMFQTGKLYIHKTKLAKLPFVKEFREACGFTTEGFENALKHVMIAFYFQEVRKHEDDRHEEEHPQEKRENYAIEFLHKSLMEYMTAEYIWEEIKSEFAGKRDGKKYIIGNDNRHEALEVVFNLFSKQYIGQGEGEIITYLQEIIQEEASTEIRQEVGERLHYFLPYMAQHEFLLAYDDRTGSTRPTVIFGRVFYGFWTVFAEAYTKRKVFERIEDIANMLRMFGAYKLNLSNMDLEGVILIQANLDRCNLSDTNLQNSFLIRADLSDANLANANLSGANLSFADLSYTNLVQTDLTDAKLGGAYLYGATMSKETYEYAKEQGAMLGNNTIIDGDKEYYIM